jgi:hypothetical protein
LSVLTVHAIKSPCRLSAASLPRSSAASSPDFFTAVCGPRLGYGLLGVVDLARSALQPGLTGLHRYPRFPSRSCPVSVCCSGPCARSRWPGPAPRIAASFRRPGALPAAVPRRFSLVPHVPSPGCLKCVRSSVRRWWNGVVAARASALCAGVIALQ